jgi:nucleoside-diphosphate-sugar epimerase
MTAQRIFVAGAAGVIGRRLTPLLRDAGHTVIGSTRSADKVDLLKSLGAEPIVVNVFDVAALAKAVEAARPDVVIHQLTDLPKDLNPQEMPEGVIRNARMRDVGTRNLVAAALIAGAKRLVAQSIAWVYTPGPEPHSESDQVDPTAHGVMSLETQVLQSPPLTGIVLRYGQFYGPGTHNADKPNGNAPVHVDAAAYAALLAVDRGGPGAYNIAQPNSYLTTAKAVTELGWSADFRR